MKYLERIGASFLGINKRDLSLPFTYDESRSGRWQRRAGEIESRAEYWAARRWSSGRASSRKKYTYALAFQDGFRNNVALLATNDLKLGPGRFDFKNSEGSIEGTEDEGSEDPTCLKDLKRT